MTVKRILFDLCCAATVVVLAKITVVLMDLDSMLFLLPFAVLWLCAASGVSQIIRYLLAEKPVIN